MCRETRDSVRPDEASPIEELKTVGIDMSTPAPIEAALDVFASLLADFQV